MTLQHRMKQLGSVLCRKLERKYIEEDYPPHDKRDLHDNFLPYCFRHVGFQPSTLHHIILRWRE